VGEESATPVKVTKYFTTNHFCQFLSITAFLRFSLSKQY